MDQIGFRVVDTHPADEEWVTHAVAVTINGRALEDHWTTAGGLAALPLSVAEAFGGRGSPHGWIAGDCLLWRSDVDLATVDADVAVGPGRVGVLTCTCGGFECGGATAHIAVDANTVTWSEFHQVLGRGPIPIGPFSFDRSTYDDAIAAVEREAQALPDA